MKRNGQVPFVRRAAKEEELEEAREEVREKRRGTSASLTAGSTGSGGVRKVQHTWRRQTRKTETKEQ